jgi:hypothetical protein
MEGKILAIILNDDTTSFKEISLEEFIALLK